MRVIIVGAGIGGLTAALTLRRAGLDVRLYEQAGELREVGAGIQISPNATRILHRLGLAEAMSAVAVRPLAFEFRRWDDGRVLTRQPLADECERAFGAPYYHFHRADLLAALAVAVPPGIVTLGRRCVAVAQRSEAAEVRFDDGTSAEADAVIGADGIHSMVREAIAGSESPRFSGSIAYRGLVPAERLTDFALERNASAWLGPERHFVHYFVSAGRYVNWVAVTPGQWRIESWTARGEVADALAEFAGWHRQVRAIIAAADSTNRWALYDRDPLERWTLGRLALLGDAAHPMLPFMAQGAGQAIEDAAVLARCLAAAGAQDAAAALARYEGMRKPRASRVQQGSRHNGSMFHLPDGEAQRARDAGFADAINGLTARNGWLYGYDAEAALEAGADAQPRTAQEQTP